MKKIMFICSGNTCRSPLAEGLFKKYLSENKITDIRVESAGILAFSGDEVSINSVLAAKNRGVDISSHRAKSINPQHISEADLFVCMTENIGNTLKRVCEPSKVISLDIPDPYGLDLDAYEDCASAIEGCFPKILKALEDTVTIRPMAENDIEEIAKLEKECFSEPWSEQALTDELSNETARFFVLRDSKNVVGYIGANNICGEVYITNVAVTKNSRGKGYGRLLVNRLIMQSRLENADFITLEVRKSNKNAIALYENCGFKKLGERKNFYSKPIEDGLIYTLYLKENNYEDFSN